MVFSHVPLCTLKPEGHCGGGACVFDEGEGGYYGGSRSSGDVSVAIEWVILLIASSHDKCLLHKSEKKFEWLSVSFATLEIDAADCP